MWQCSSDGRSKVDATTSARSTCRRMSVTSSGRSSTSSTITWHSGLLRSIEYTICLMIVVLPALGGETIMPRWPLPIGEIRSMMRPVISPGSSSSSSRSLESGNKRREVLEPGAVARLFDRGVVDEVDADERRVLLAARRRAGRALHVVALAQAEAPHLRRRDVRVVAAGEVARRPQEAVALVAQVEQALDLDLVAAVLVAAFHAFAPFGPHVAGHARLAGHALAVTAAAPTPALVARPVVVPPLLLAGLGAVGGARVAIVVRLRPPVGVAVACPGRCRCPSPRASSRTTGRTAPRRRPGRS